MLYTPITSRLIMIKQNRRVVNKAQNRYVFQSNPPIVPVTYHDISDALIASENLTHNQKKEYFYCQGIDYDNVCRYYDYVKSFEDRVNNDNIIAILYKAFRSSTL
jgi:hypothetical protein